ncbi:hypothetical protein SCHPADRAFT_1001673, partial [Schizopora paradoxa]
MKRERSSTPPLDLTARSVTSGTHLVLPLPPECHKTLANPNYADARRRLAGTTKRMLVTKGLRPSKIVIRDDGIAIDWTSAVPVWSDTYLPVESGSNAMTAAASFPPREEHGSREKAIPPIPENEGRIEDEDESELENLAAEFFVRYARVFDTERRNIANAYHPDAKFSYAVHELVQRNTLAAAFMNVKKVERFAAYKNSRNLIQHHNGRIYTGRSEIEEAISSFGHYKFCETSPADVQFDTVRLDHSFVQFLCHGNLCNTAGQMISFEQSFLLVKPGENRDADVDASSDPWPLLIVSHLLTVRDPSLMLK